MPADEARTLARLRAAFGGLYDTLVDEAPERAAWRTLGFEAVEAAIARARERVHDPVLSLGFRTLLKQELDAACELTPPIMGFEAASLPYDRALRQRAQRFDANERERERAAERRRHELWHQAHALVRGEEP